MSKNLTTKEFNNLNLSERFLGKEFREVYGELDYHNLNELLNGSIWLVQSNNQPMCLWQLFNMSDWGYWCFRRNGQKIILVPEEMEKHNITFMELLHGTDSLLSFIG